MKNNTTTPETEQLLRLGKITPIQPGIYVATDRFDEPRARLDAVATAYPDGVFVGHTAAALHWPDTYQLSEPFHLARPSGASRTKLVHAIRAQLHHRIVCMVDDFPTLTSPATACYLAGFDDGRAIDLALRQGIPLADIKRTRKYFAHWPRGTRRRQVLTDSRDEPWSQFERAGHRMLRAAGLTGWKANYSVKVHGRQFFIDAAFPAHRVGLEFDSLEFHNNSDSFERDRIKMSLLASIGWLMIPISPGMMREQEELVRLIRRTLQQRLVGGPVALSA